VRNDLLTVRNWSISCKNGCEDEKLQVARNDAIYHVMMHYRCSASVEKQLRERFEGIELQDVPPLVCGDCIKWFCSRVRSLDRDLPSELELVDS